MGNRRCCCDAPVCTTMCSDGLPEQFLLTIPGYGTLTLTPDGGIYAPAEECKRYGGYLVDASVDPCIQFVDLAFQPPGLFMDLTVDCPFPTVSYEYNLGALPTTCGTLDIEPTETFNNTAGCACEIPASGVTLEAI